MKEDPAPISQIAPMSPPALERLVRQCLAKNPDDRWQSAGDVKRELEWIAGGSQSGSVTGAPVVKPQQARHASSRVAITAAAAVVLAAMAYFLGPWKPGGTAAPPLVRFTLSAPPGITLGGPAEAEISPDGRSIVFVGFDSTGTDRLYLRPLSSPEARVLPGTDGAGTPFWSPDSRAIGFFSSGKLRKVALDGSPPVVLCDAPDARGGSWSPRGVIAFVPNNASPVWRVPASGGAAVQVTKLDAKLGERGHRYPQFLPDGRHFLYVGIGESEERSTFAMPIDGGDPVEVCRASSIARFAAPGHLLFLEGGVTAPQRRLLARRFDPGTRKASGDAVLVLDRVNATNFGYANVTASPNGTLVVQHWGQARARLAWRDLRGASLGVAVEDLEVVNELSLSPDGRRLAVAGDGGNDLAVFELASGIKTRLTFENSAVSNMIWSADGRRIVFARLNGSRGWDIRVKAVDEASPESVVFKGPSMLNYPRDWSQDNKWLVARCADSTGNFDLWKIPMDGSGAPEPYLRTPANEISPTLSRDGRWISYGIMENGQQSTFVQAFPNPGAKYQVALKAPGFVGWSRREDALLAGIDNEVYRIAVSTEGGFRQGATTPWMRIPPNEFLVGFAPDERRVLVGELKDTRSITQLEVVLNWRELLERR
jgi:Tol biopolymer transport system component